MTNNEIDNHVGKKLRLFRKMADLTQGGLADQIGVTFQQVQKYEGGKNRVSASRLYLAANALGVQVGDFFEGIST